MFQGYTWGYTRIILVVPITAHYKVRFYQDSRESLVYRNFSYRIFTLRNHTTIYALMNEGKLSSIKLGRRRLIEDESIDRLIADSRESKDDS